MRQIRFLWTERVAVFYPPWQWFRLVGTGTINAGGSARWEWRERFTYDHEGD